MVGWEWIGNPTVIQWLGSGSLMSIGGGLGCFVGLHRLVSEGVGGSAVLVLLGI
jgi:hypothetical protein